MAVALTVHERSFIFYSRVRDIFLGKCNQSRERIPCFFLTDDTDDSGRPADDQRMGGCFY